MDIYSELDIPITKLKGLTRLFEPPEFGLKLEHDEAYGVTWVLTDIVREFEKVQKKAGSQCDKCSFRLERRAEFKARSAVNSD